MRFLANVCAVFFLVSFTAAAAAHSNLAPADEYFGRLQMSILGIANTIKDAGLKLENGGNPESAFNGPLSFAADSIHAWERKYPNDPWIAKNLLKLEQVYLRVQTAHGRALARETEAWLVHDYPYSPAAAVAQRSH